MNSDRQVAMSQERLHVKHVRHFYRSIADINLELAKIHKSIEILIDKEKYRLATEYVNQYISYTSIWNVKFVYNIENPEVAMLQIFHLDYIFDHELKSRFKNQRALLEELKNKFSSLKAFNEDHINLRKQKMLDYITSQEKNLTDHHE